MNNSLKKIVLSICLTGALVLGVNAPAVAHPVFSKLIIFGDSLSDVGNNQDGLSDQAPETNKMPADTDSGFRNGDVWVVYLSKFLKDHGYLVNNGKSNVIQPSNLFDQNIEVDPSESIDVAYAGDPSGGFSQKGQSNIFYQYHAMNEANNTGCIKKSDLHYTPSKMNQICGLRARAFEFIHNPLTRKYLDPNALYVIWIGANDIQQRLQPKILPIIAKLAKGVYTKAQAEKALTDAGTGVVGDTVINISTTIEDLKYAGAKYFLVLNLPNLGYTPEGYKLNRYTNENILPQYPDFILEAFDTLTKNFNKALSDFLNNISNVTIYQPDFDLLFSAIHEGKTKAFSGIASNINANPVFSWQELCCANHQNTQSFDPSTCTITTDTALKPFAENFCNTTTKDPKTKDMTHYFAFYNSIHPSTCSNAYIARYAGRTVIGKETSPDTIESWDPTNSETMPGCALL